MKQKRLQRENGDTVLEITEDKPIKTRVSKKALERRKAYLEESIINFNIALDNVHRALEDIRAAEMKQLNDANHIGGFLTIKKFKDGELLWQSEPLPNKVVMGAAGYGRNLIVRQLAGDITYSIEIDSAKLGTSSTAAADGQTDLVAATVSGIAITNKSAVDDDLSVDVFVADANLPNGTYREFGLFCNGRLFARVVISPDYTKASGEDTLFSYSMSLT